MDTGNANIAVAPLPDQRTLKRRQSIPLQAWRFVLMNLRIVLMVLKGSH